MSQEVHFTSTFDASGANGVMRSLSDVNKGMLGMLATGARVTEMGIGTARSFKQMRDSTDTATKALAGLNVITNTVQTGIELTNSLISEQEKRWDAAAAAAARANVPAAADDRFAKQIEEAKKYGFELDKNLSREQQVQKLQEFLKKEGLSGIKLGTGEAARDGAQLEQALKGLVVTGKEVSDTAIKITNGMKVRKEQIGLTDEEVKRIRDTQYGFFSAAFDVWLRKRNALSTVMAPDTS